MPERVAVVIPCYNHARYVGEALESVLGQTRKPDRVLALDDGSKDTSLEVLHTFAGRGVEVFAQENRGAHATINRLVELAATDCDWVAILNSDDRYLPRRLELGLEAARQRPGQTVIATGLRVIGQDGAVLPEDAARSRWFHGAWSLGNHNGTGIPEWLGQANFVATTSNLLVRASYLRANPFRPYRFNHDYFFLVTAMLDNQIQVCPEVLLEYRVHGSNTISTRPEPLMQEMLRMHLDLYRQQAPRLVASPELRKRFYSFARSSWDNISSFHAGLFQVALAQLAEKRSDDELAALASGMEAPEFDEFPNKVLTNALYGETSHTTAGTLGRRVEELSAERDVLKNEREALDRLSRYRHRMLRSRWIRLGLMIGACRALVSSRGKKPLEKMLWLRDTCATHLWLRIGEKLGSQSSHDLRRGLV
jgi:glycosyltransferase involved in cell wall biosynthesis